MKDGDEALRRADDVAAAVVLSLARRGIGYSTQGSDYVGVALEWRRMDYERRRLAMTEAILACLSHEDLHGSEPPTIRIANRTVGLVCDAIPSSMGTAAARELVGQPFLHDHERVATWPSDVHGPVHLIACQKGVTETQALRQLGFPDALVVPAPFGVYVADRGQRIQMAFLAKCRDETSTRKATQEFLQWLTSSGEAEFLADRAVIRRRLCELMRRPDEVRMQAEGKAKKRKRG